MIIQSSIMTYGHAISSMPNDTCAVHFLVPIVREIIGVSFILEAVLKSTLAVGPCPGSESVVRKEGIRTIPTVEKILSNNYERNTRTRSSLSS